MLLQALGSRASASTSGTTTAPVSTTASGSSTVTLALPPPLPTTNSNKARDRAGSLCLLDPDFLASHLQAKGASLEIVSPMLTSSVSGSSAASGSRSAGVAVGTALELDPVGRAAHALVVMHSSPIMQSVTSLDARLPSLSLGAGPVEWNGAASSLCSLMRPRIVGGVGAGASGSPGDIKAKRPRSLSTLSGGLGAAARRSGNGGTAAIHPRPRARSLTFSSTSPGASWKKDEATRLAVEFDGIDNGDDDGENDRLHGIEGGGDSNGLNGVHRYYARGTGVEDDELDGAARVGAYSPRTRRLRVERFLLKRQNRMWHKSIKYNVRKNFADSRLRVKGRFVRKEDEAVLRDLMMLT